MLHGRLPADAKDEVMRRFAAGEVDVLVATTVIEVGVDVAERDRDGRPATPTGSASPSCTSCAAGSAGGRRRACACSSPTCRRRAPARARLDAVAATVDGFELARVDLESRREGDVLGASQSGRRSSLRLLSVLRDEEVIELARDEATRLVAADPDLFAERRPARGPWTPCSPTSGRLPGEGVSGA